MPARRISIFRQLVPPEPTWQVEDIPDQKGRVVIVTGGNRGVGKETARVLLSKGATVYIAARTEGKKERGVVEELQKITGKDSVFFIQLNLSDLHSVKAAAEEFKRREKQLHILYNNDSVMYTPTAKLTKQGYDYQFGSNVLGHFYFTQLLLDVLLNTVRDSPPRSVRVINVSSIGHYFGAPDGIRWETLGLEDEAMEERKNLGTARLFGQSKTGNILYSNELARRYGPQGIVSISLHPGTNLSRHAGNLVQRCGQLMKFIFFYMISCGDLSFLSEDSLAKFAEGHISSAAHNVEGRVNTVTSRIGERANTMSSFAAGEVPDSHAAAPEEEAPHPPSAHGAITSLYAGTAPSAGQYSGKYLTSWARVTLPHPKAINQRNEKKLWEWCEEQVKITFEKPPEPANDAPAEKSPEEQATSSQTEKPIEEVQVKKSPEEQATSSQTEKPVEEVKVEKKPEEQATAAQAEKPVEEVKVEKKPEEQAADVQAEKKSEA